MGVAGSFLLNFCSLCLDKGFCARGMQCRYEHGPDTMYALPNGNMPPMPFPFMMPFPPNGPVQGGPAGPGESGPPGGGPAMDNVMQVDGLRAGGTKPDEYSPDQPGMSGPPGPYPGMGSPNGVPPFPFSGPPPPDMLPFMMGMPGMPPGMPRMPGGFPPFNQNGGRGNGRVRGGGARGGRGGRSGPEGFNNWDGDLSTRPPPDHSSTTLVVADIPTEHLNLESIHNQFKQFGTVTNVAVEARAKKAMVAFANSREAYGAWSSKESFFGDRHVKVLWHRPREGQGGAGQKALEDSAPLLENLRKIDQEGVDAIQSAARSNLPTVDPEIKAQLAGVRERSLQLEKIVAEQKVFMNRLEGAKDAEEKTRLKTRLKELIAESAKIKQANAGIDVAKLQAIIDAQTKAREEALAAKQNRIQARPKDGVHSIQEMLDQEMEEHNIQAQLEGSKDKKDEDVDEETLRLRAQLAALKNQVRLRV
jgi:RNA-binding protein 26